MIRKIYLGLLVVLATFFTSCEFSETIYINEDGTGKMSMYFDGSDLMPMVSGQMPVGTNGEAIDSTLSFKELLKEAKLNVSKLSKADQQKIKSLNDMKVHMQIDEANNKLNLDIFSNFKKVSDLQNMFDAMGTLGKLGGNSASARNPLAAVDVENVSDVQYVYNNNSFKREFRVKDRKLLDSLKQNLGQLEMLFAASTYRLDYHFPKKIKTLSLREAVVAEDGKSFTMEVSVMDFVNNPELLNFEVAFEN